MSTTPDDLQTAHDLLRLLLFHMGADCSPVMLSRETFDESYGYAVHSRRVMEGGQLAALEFWLEKPGTVQRAADAAKAGAA